MAERGAFEPPLASPAAAGAAAVRPTYGGPAAQHALTSGDASHATSATGALAALIARLLDTPAMHAKRSIQRPARALHRALPAGDPAAYALPGDDCAAIRCADGYQLFAIEGMLPAFVEAAPWFAGWSAVMANVSDIAAMGGRATAVVNAWWHHDAAAVDALLAGMRDACDAYGLVLAGGHSSFAQGHPGTLAVAIIGHATRLLSTLHVASGQRLCMAVDLDGHWHQDAAYWKAFEGVSAVRLRAKLEVLPRLADAGLLIAAKDISNAGVLGTLMMLLEPTGCGADLDLAALPAPADGDLERWLQAFPSYGFLLTLNDADLAVVQAAFAFEGICCEPVGRINASGKLRARTLGDSAEVWDMRAQAFTGFQRQAIVQGEPACPP